MIREKAIDVVNNAQAENILNQRMDHFLKHFKPKDPYDAMNFEVALHSLMRAVYAEAAKPYEKTMSAMLFTLPMPPIFVKEPK